MERTRILPDLFADGAVVDKGGDESTVGLGGTKNRLDAIGCGQNNRGALAFLRGELAWRIYHIKAEQGDAVTLAGEKDAAGPHAVRQLLGLVRLGAGPNLGAAGGERVNDTRAGAEHINRHGRPAWQLPRRHQRRKQ